jgi:hypothetical protein
MKPVLIVGKKAMEKSVFGVYPERERYPWSDFLRLPTEAR